MIMCVLLCYPVSIRIYYQQGGRFLVSFSTTCGGGVGVGCGRGFVCSQIRLNVFQSIYLVFLTDTISIARALTDHNPDDPYHLPFRKGDTIRVISKSAGQKPDLWGGEVNGRSGYFPAHLVKDFQVYNHRPLHHVPTMVRCV